MVKARDLRILWVLVAVLVFTGAIGRAELPSISDKTQGTKKIDGYFPLYWDEEAGTMWLEIERFDQEFLYVTGLDAGVGSNDIGLDRGQIGGSHVVTFQRVGPKILLVEPNYDYRAESPNADERKAVEEAFAKSILWGFKAAAASDGRVLVDASDFLIRDVHGVADALKNSGSGNYKLDPSRSALYLPRTRAFPKNTEISVTLTFISDNPSGYIRTVTPTPEAVTVREHISLVELPGPGYEPREADPRSGYGVISYMDYSVPLGVPMTKQFIRRHRLKKKDPSAAVSEAVEPIVYYLDRGTPEPIRSALLEGASWWNEAFEAAGYRDAFQVKVMPEDADSLDVRYNVIQWVHRSTRGWSYGNSITDPRTGEIIKGHVSLGSLRVRQDYLIAEGLLSPYEAGSEAPPALATMALARIRQLSAHEVGHTLGLGHNYYASRLGRVSVLDYPHPLVTLAADGSIDLSDAYDVGIGEWDKVAIDYGYRQFPPGTDKKAALTKILDDARSQDLVYLTNQDLEANPVVHQWANGTDPAAELKRMLQVRRAALDRFGERAIQAGRPMATIEEVLVPLYLHHRYQVDATASAVGGVYFSYAMRGDGQEPVRRVPADEQRRALEALLQTIDPAELAIPEGVINQLPPRPSNFWRHRELFPRYTGPTFDAISPAVVAADLTVSNLLEAERAARLVEQHSLDPNNVSLAEVIDGLIGKAFGASPSDAYQAEINRAVEWVIADRLMRLAANSPMPQVRAIATRGLETIKGKQAAGGSEAEQALAGLLVQDIERFLTRPAEPFKPLMIPNAPPGSPIGQPGFDYPFGGFPSFGLWECGYHESSGH